MNLEKKRTLNSLDVINTLINCTSSTCWYNTKHRGKTTKLF